MSNKRRSPRRHVHDFGKIIFSAGNQIVACVIVDISEDGARLLFDTGAIKNGAQVPATFVLHHKKAGSFHDAKVVRRSGRTVAVRLLSSLDHSEFGDKRIAALWR
jgi:hypothetical protein